MSCAVAAFATAAVCIAKDDESVTLDAVCRVLGRSISKRMSVKNERNSEFRTANFDQQCFSWTLSPIWTYLTYPLSTSAHDYYWTKCRYLQLLPSKLVPLSSSLFLPSVSVLASWFASVQRLDKLLLRKLRNHMKIIHYRITGM